jgi:hypothetical protein
MAGRCPKRIDYPKTAVFSLGHQGTDTDNRVVDVLRKLVAEFGSDFIIVRPPMTIRSGEAFQVRDSFNIPNDDVSHEQATHSKVHSRRDCECAHFGGSMDGACCGAGDLAGNFGDCGTAPITAGRRKLSQDRANASQSGKYMVSVHHSTSVTPTAQQHRRII